MPQHFNYSQFFDVQEFIEPAKDITATCWNWCSEQVAIHQSNIDISNLATVGVAMAVLLLYNISVEYSDFVSEKLNISKDILRFIGHTLVYFAFMLLAVFLGYYIWFN